MASFTVFKRALLFWQVSFMLGQSRLLSLPSHGDKSLLIAFDIAFFIAFGSSRLSLPSGLPALFCFSAFVSERILSVKRVTLLTGASSSEMSNVFTGDLHRSSGTPELGLDIVELTLEEVDSESWPFCCCTSDSGCCCGCCCCCCCCLVVLFDCCAPPPPPPWPWERLSRRQFTSSTLTNCLSRSRYWLYNSTSLCPAPCNFWWSLISRFHLCERLTFRRLIHGSAIIKKNMLMRKFVSPW